MASSVDVVACVRGLLVQPLEISLVAHRSFRTDFAIAPSVVNSYRLLWVRSGSLHYAMTGWGEEVRTGSLLLVPAWMKRGWRSSKAGKVDLYWVEFNPAAELLFPQQPYFWKSDDVERERQAFARMLAVGKERPTSSEVSLLLEGELKALLGRLAWGCSVGKSMMPAEALPTGISREIAAVAARIEQHHARPDVLDQALRQVQSGDHYFRTRFREQTGYTLGQYTDMVRMRRARYLLASSPVPIKQVAWEVGFRDPLHFSRRYRVFWGHSPRQDRG